MRERSIRPRADAPRWVGAVTGVVVAAFALGIGHLAAAFVADGSSPLVAVGQAAIDLAPRWLKTFAIRTFGTHDKTALLIGMIVVIVVLAALVGVGAARRPWVGTAALVGLGAVGAVAAVTRPDATALWAIPSIVATLAAVAVFDRLLARAGVDETGVAESSSAPVLVEVPDEAAPPHGFDRRAFVRAAFAVGGAAAFAGLAGTGAGERRFRAAASRAAVRIPRPAAQAGPLPSGAALDVPGLSPFVTPTADFYRVDTALFPPQVQAQDWRLQIHGMVDREVSLDYRQLLKRELVERDVTLCCVSNEVGGRYAGNARWVGALLTPILDEAGVQAGATQLVSRSADGMTIGTPTEVVMDGRDAMLAVSMNGEPLPIVHGFPVRMVVPGLYGYVSATKWVVDLELTTFDAYDPYWIARGWAEPGPIRTASRIDTPRASAQVAAGSVPVAGVAWAQHRGIERVEVRVDGATWADATLSVQDTVDTWRQWVWMWDATPGPHTLEVRATDGMGVVQTQERADPFPSGATGWHTIEVSVV